MTTDKPSAGAMRAAGAINRYYNGDFPPSSEADWATIIDRETRLSGMISALRQVSFYARINHGSKARDYGELVNPILEVLGIPTGQPAWIDVKGEQS